MERFKQLRNSSVIRMEHVFKERNHLADYFANMGTYFAGTKNCNNIQEVPSQGRKINMEKVEVPSLRIHQCQNKGYGCTQSHAIR